MNQKKNLSTSSRCATFKWAVALALIICAASAGKVSAAAADSLDQVYEKAKKEGKITLYAPLSPQAMSVIPPAFMKRFPGVTVDHIDATSDKRIARVLSEQKGGRVLADVISGALTYLPQILDLKIVEQVAIPGERHPGMECHERRHECHARGAAQRDRVDEVAARVALRQPAERGVVHRFHRAGHEQASGVAQRPQQIAVLQQMLHFDGDVVGDLRM